MKKVSFALGAGAVVAGAALVVWPTVGEWFVMAPSQEASERSSTVAGTQAGVDVVVNPLIERPMSQAPSVPHQRASSEVSSIAPQRLSKVPVSYEHQTIIDNGKGDDGGDDLHTMLEKEPKDTAWAYETEQYLRQLYQDTGAQIYSLECRSTLCEIQAFTDDRDSDARMAQVQEGIDMRHLMPMGIFLPVGNRQTYLLYFSRPEKKKPPTEAELEGRRRRLQAVQAGRSQ